LGAEKINTGFIRSDFLKNVGIIFSSTFVAQIIAFFAQPMLTRWYPNPEVHGALTNFMAMVSIATVVAALQFDQAIIIENDRSKARSLVKLASLITLVFSALSMVIVVVFYNTICQKFLLTDSAPWLYWVPPTIFAIALMEILLVWWNRERKYQKMASNRILGMSVGTGYKLLHPNFSASFFSFNGLIAGQVLGSFVQAVLLLPKNLSQHLHFQLSELKILAKQYRSFATLATPSALINMLGSYLPVFLITLLFSQADTGFFGNANKLTFIPLSAISYALGSVYFERLSRLRNEDEQRKKLSKSSLNFMYAIALLPVVILTVWGDSLVPWYLGQGWEEAGKMVQILVGFYFIIYLSSPFSAAFEVYSELKAQLVFTSIFTIGIFTAFVGSYAYEHSLLQSLLWMAVIGSMVRLVMLLYCFRLLKTNILRNIVLGLLVWVSLTLIGFWIKNGNLL
jgi:O-antigen/teichoic acid export membrane protein